MDKQSDSYKAACDSGQDPDADGQVECFAPPAAKKPDAQLELGKNPPVPNKPGKMGGRV